MPSCHLLGWDGVGCKRLERVLSTHAPSVLAFAPGKTKYITKPYFHKFCIKIKHKWDISEVELFN